MRLFGPSRIQNTTGHNQRSLYGSRACDEMLIIEILACFLQIGLCPDIATPHVRYMKWISSVALLTRFRTRDETMNHRTAGLPTYHRSVSPDLHLRCEHVAILQEAGLFLARALTVLKFSSLRPGLQDLLLTSRSYIIEAIAFVDLHIHVEARIAAYKPKLRRPPSLHRIPIENSGTYPCNECTLYIFNSIRMGILKIAQIRVSHA